MALNDVHETFLGLSCRVCMYVCPKPWVLGFEFGIEMQIERASFRENKRKKQNTNSEHHPSIFIHLKLPLPLFGCDKSDIHDNLPVSMVYRSKRVKRLFAPAYIIMKT